jgi:RNA polymerase primary sigma factor
MPDLYSIAKRYPLLKPEQEILLSRDIQAWVAIRDKPPTTAATRRIHRRGIRARDTLVVHNLRFAAMYVSRTFRCLKTLEHEDCLQVASIGLAIAAERYSPRHGCRFVTYATLWIRQTINREIERADTTIRIPSHMHQLRAKALALTGRGVSLTEAIHQTMAGRTMSVDYLFDAMAATAPMGAIDGPIKGEDDLFLHEMLPDPSSDPRPRVEAEIDAELLQLHLSRLQDHYQDVICRRYGIGRMPESLADVARDYGVTRQAVSLKCQRAIEVLRRMVAA